jgi:flagellar hook assembly protein FlgD
MKRIIFISILAVLISGTAASAGDKLIAYPVPFDPGRQSLRLKFEPERPAGNLHVEIYDINGDLLLSRDYSYNSNGDNGFRWKGYDSQGRSVSNGMYIVKTKWEDAASGKIKTDAVRITVVKRK